MSYNEEQAYIEVLLIKKQLNEITPEELQQLEALLKANEEAVRQSHWFETKASQSIGDIKTLEVDDKWNHFQAQINGDQHPTRSRWWIRPYSIVAAAAVLGVVLLAMNQFFFQQPAAIDKIADQSSKSTANQVTLRLGNGTQVVLNQTGRQTVQAGDAQLVADNKTLNLAETKSEENSWNILEVPRKLDYKIKLPDGSSVHLNSASKLKFPLAFNSNKREVYIEGEAYFTVVEKAEVPFIVHTPAGDIQVLGTEFNVNTYATNVLKTALVSGSVRVNDKNNSTVLKPGEYLTCNEKGKKLSTLDTKSILSWRNGVYFFRNTPFREIADMIPRWFDIQVIIDDEELNNMPFTGQLDKSESLESFLAPIQYTSGINYTLRGKLLHIYK